MIDYPTSDKRLLVTGAGGFIGKNLMERLSAAIVMDKRWGSSTVAAERLEAVIEKWEPEIIVHLGANCSSQISLREPAVDFEDNVVGTFNVCEAARKYGVPIIFNSTMKIYPGIDGKIPPYGISKLVGEHYLRLYREVYGVRSIINRPSSVYGPLQDGSEDGGWFTWFVKASILGEPITLFGDGTQSRDVLYVDDHVNLLVDQIENFDLYADQEFDFGGGKNNVVSLEELLEVLDYHNVRYAPRLPGDVQHFCNDNSLVTAINGWAPQVGWREGLERTAEWLAPL
jgi:nucleoside-diphosphate-sugar epimerase